MQIFSQSRKTIILLTMMLSALIFSSCAIQKAENKEDVLQPIVSDAGSTVDTPIEDNEYSDDFIIEIERPNIKGDGHDATSDDVTDDVDSDSESSGFDRNNNSISEELADDDTELMGGYEGSNTEIDDEDEETEETEETDSVDYPVFDPNDVEMGENADKIDLYDVPLSAEKQSYVMEMAEYFNIPPELIFGVMYVESRYDETVISSNGKHIGIMQIAKSNLNTLNKKFGITDLTDYLQNVKSGAYFLSYFYKKYDGDINKVLMCYHCGEGGANTRWRNGITQDSYCRKVIKEMNRILSAE